MRSTLRWVGGRCSRQVFWSSKRLGHNQEVARELGTRVAGEWRSAGLDVTEFLVEPRELRPQIDDAEIHEAAAGGAAMIFGGSYQKLADSGALQRGIHG